jgi:hypothetical protein
LIYRWPIIKRTIPRTISLKLYIKKNRDEIIRFIKIKDHENEQKNEGIREKINTNGLELTTWFKKN